LSYRTLSKLINDANGHSIGDQVLQSVVQRTCQHLRAVDVIGRIGGDEFAILLPETSLPAAMAIAERIVEAVLEAPLLVKQPQLRVSVSLGLTEAKGADASIESLLNIADMALYEAKHKGGNQVAALNKY
jgi:diguanylate cyclase (GGDEF)-like protein